MSSILAARRAVNRHEDCWHCGKVCRSGAVVRLGSAEKKTARMGLAKVDMDLCLLGEGRECDVCKNCCPYDAIRVDFSEEEYTTVVRIDRDRCPGCGACEAACPTAPKKAIAVHAETLDSRRPRELGVFAR